MQNVSATYTSIVSGAHRAEWKVTINSVDYGETVLESLEINRSVFSDTPTLGMCVSAEIDLSMLKPSESIPRMALIEPYIRVTNGLQTSEWLPKGKFYIDTRETTKNDGVDIMTIHGYDAMLMAEQMCPLDNFPQTDAQAVQDICDFLGFTPDNVGVFNKGYTIPIPGEYSCREVLGYIAGMYGGCFVMDDFGNLRLVKLNGMPAETNFLINTAGYVITFGGVKIIV